MSLLAVENLQTHFKTQNGINRAVDGVSFRIDPAETIALVGESGCGKSVLANSILRLVPEPPGKISGKVCLEGVDVLSLPKSKLQAIRGKEIGMIFQDPMTSLNPVLTIGHQISETLLQHQGIGRAAAGQRTIQVLSDVGVAEPERCAMNYPHQLSGGMQQRAMIAIALSCKPKLLIADEPTTALDVTIQAQILDLLRDAKSRLGMAMMLITHDLGVAAEIAERIIVMYAGHQVEVAPAAQLFGNPRHPYTQGLLNALPMPGVSKRAQNRRLTEIPGTVPVFHASPIGCVFATRCAFASDLCRRFRPALEEKGPGHFAACHYAIPYEVPR